jgi:hypothetical protein
MRDLIRGDFLFKDNSNGKRKVMGVCGDIHFLSRINDFDVVEGYYTKKQIIELGLKPCESEMNPTDLVMNERILIADILSANPKEQEWLNRCFAGSYKNGQVECWGDIYDEYKYKWPVWKRP